MHKGISVKRVTWSFYIISALYTLSSSFAWGINTLFLLDSGLDIFQVFVANACFTASMSLFEIPTGVFADTRGRRYSFLLAVFFNLIGSVGYVLSSYMTLGLIAFCFFSVVLGLGFTFYSGAVEAWVVDELQEAGYSGQLDRIFSRGAALSGVTMILGTIGGGFLGTLDLRLPYLGRIAALFLLLFFAFFFMKERGFTPFKDENHFYHHMKRITANSLQFGWKQKTLRSFMGVSFLISIFMMWGFYASQPYLLDLLDRPDAVWISGLVASGIALAQILGNSLVEPLRKISRRRSSLLLLSALIMPLASVGLGLSGRFLPALLMLLLFMVAMGIFQPVKQAQMHQLIPREQRATVISFDSLVGNLGGMSGQPSLGWISKSFSIGTAYLASAVPLALTLPLLFGIRKRGEADLTEEEK